MKNSKKILIAAIMLGLCFILGAGGVVPVAGSGSDPDASLESSRLCGMLITQSPLELDPDTGVLYAEEAADSSGETEYVFPGADGQAFFLSSADNIRQAVSDEIFSQPNINIYAEESGIVSVTLEGTAYTDGTEMTLFVNPVYLVPDGRMYAAAGNSVAIGADGVTLTLEDPGDTGTEASEEEEMPFLTRVQLAVEPLAEPQGTVRRNLYQKEDETLQAYTDGPDGFIIEKSLRIIWD